MRNIRPFPILLVSSLSVFIFSKFFACNSPEKPGEEWTAPADAHKLINPLPNNLANVQKGKELYNLYCGSCHGELGFGDGPARGPLGQKPANFHERKFKRQHNGDVFWKISTGRKDMPPFEKILSEEQRWQLVSYIRNIPGRQELTTPVALRPDIKVQHFMTIEPEAVRILHHPITGDLWYT